MKPVCRVSGSAVPLPRDNIDTDAIIPQRYLVTVDKEGMVEGFFGGWRRDDQGGLDPSFPLNRPEYAGAHILLAGANYGCGSSREHAVWAHLAWGIQAVIAPSFGAIFYENAVKNGLLLIAMDRAQMTELLVSQQERAGQIDIDLEAQTLSTGERMMAFSIEPRVRSALLQGADEIRETLAHDPVIEAFQARDRTLRPWVWEGIELRCP